MLTFSKRLVCCVALILAIAAAKGQDDPSIKKYSDSLTTAYAKGDYCGNKNRKSLEALNNLWPLDSSHEIRLVSYKLEHMVTHTSDLAGTLENILILGDLRDKLVDVLFNYKIASDGEQTHFCWSPRNAIVFLNAKKELIGQINLCFECSTSFERSVKVFLGVDCPEKWQLLKLIFASAGIKHGVLGVIFNEADGKNHKTEDNTAYTFVDQSAEPVGGLEKFYQWINKNLKYPASVRREEIIGKVFIKFIIEPTGSITNIEVVRGLDPDCDNEAIRLMSISPKWKPGRMAGRAVRQYYTLPINFQIH
jgi:protein TonB